MGVGASQRIPLSVLMQNPHKRLAREVPETVGKTEHSAEGNRREQSTGESSQEMRVGERGDQSTEVRKAAARTF